MQTYHALRSTSRPAPMIVPQLITFGSPSPRKARPASVRIAVATISEPVTMIGAAAFGRQWRTMIRKSPMPIASHACTNSRPRRLRNSPRVSRATGGHDTTPIASTIVVTDGVKIATSTIAKRNAGIVWNSSVTRMSTVSIQPP